MSGWVKRHLKSAARIPWMMTSLEDEIRWRQWMVKFPVLLNLLMDMPEKLLMDDFLLPYRSFSFNRVEVTDGE